jgi:prepilin-type N-terminal cleavage/methylation domain-containing protein
VQKAFYMRKAFTLVELLVVIAIIALLISILAPSLKVAKDIARIMVCSTNMKGTGTAVVMYAESSKGFIPPYDPKGGNLANMYSPGDPWKNARAISWTSEKVAETYRGYGVLYQAGMAPAQLFYCPSWMDPEEEHALAHWPVPWDSRGLPDGGGWRTTKVSYHLSPIQTKKDVDIGRQIYLLSKFESDNILAMDMLGDPYWTVHKNPAPTWNTGFADTHVVRKDSRTTQTAMEAGGGTDFDGDWAAWQILFDTFKK